MHKIYAPIVNATVIFLILTSTTVAASVEIKGILENADGKSLSGRITVIQEVPSLTFTHHEVDESGEFSFSSDTQGALVLHASALHHPSAEHVISAGTVGVVTVDFELPLGQAVEVRVIDAEGSAVAGATLRVRYHEPEKPVRRVSFHHEEGLTDGDGRLILPDVGIEVPFVVDVLAPNYSPASSKRTKLAAGDTLMDDIVLGEPGAIVVVELLDKAGDPVPDTWITMLADPAGMTSDTRGSWLHSRAFRQRAGTSALGNVRFAGVPVGRIIVRVKTATDSIEGRGIAVSNEELRFSLTMP